MRLVRRENSESDTITFCGVMEYQNMAELRADMKAEPQRFGDGEYSLIEERPWLHNVKETKVKVEEVL